MTWPKNSKFPTRLKNKISSLICNKIIKERYSWTFLHFPKKTHSEMCSPASTVLICFNFERETNDFSRKDQSTRTAINKNTGRIEKSWFSRKMYDKVVIRVFTTRPRVKYPKIPIRTNVLIRARNVAVGRGTLQHVRISIEILKNLHWHSGQRCGTRDVYDNCRFRIHDSSSYRRFTNQPRHSVFFIKHHIVYSTRRLSLCPSRHFTHFLNRTTVPLNDDGENMFY